ncbi:winged helix-turn-helix domain-containing protein [Kumtagia ephedrae]|jgi:DNA-binding response OmpR family regulator|uniref:DNA-binding response regulator n=1 Tax=Kumtagia ephedrae TaxID=2116701 RepID=A0A2P7S2S9_9HYPH|nr:response regulator transcription factor [Mesorhizobium ephedrae]PSJ56763.1 DNA-binding response regulator [Mesorhizobium ephedrae]
MTRRPTVALACLPEAFAEQFGDYLDRRGYDVRRADEEWELRPLLASPRIDVLVLGDELPSAAVLSLLRRLQGESDPCVVLLRTRTELVETVLALELGAADVIDAPADMRELAARIAGLLVRRGRPGPELVSLENATVDVRSALVMHRSGEEEQLSPGQVALLKLFLANPRKVLSRDDIIAAAPAESTEAFDRSIDSRIVRLRRKLDTDTIVTIRGTGYRFDPPADWPE